MSKSDSSPWFEKYRPKDFADIKEQGTVIKIARALVKQNLPMNLIFVGPPGTGKTSLAKIIITKILGSEESPNMLEVNASDKVRMDYIRHELNDFIHQISINRQMKIVLMEEADNIPSDAQQALRRTMETAHKTTRFILTCNYLSNIISAIRSRCMVIRFQKVSIDGVRNVVISILDEEGVELKDDSEKVIETLQEATDGDMRMMINTLQSCDPESPIKSIREMLGIINPTLLRILSKLVLKGNIKKIIAKLNVMNKTSPRHFLLQFGDYIIHDHDHDADDLARICRLVADYDKRLSVAGDQEVQLIGFISKLCLMLGVN